MKIKPLMNRVFISQDEATNKTASGLIIPDDAKEKPSTGKVVAIGPGLKDEPMTVKIGDSVMYGKFTGIELSHEGGTYLIVRETELYAIV